MAVGMPITVHVDTKISFSFSIRGTIVVRQIKVRDTQVKAGTQNALLRGKRGDVSKIVPQA